VALEDLEAALLSDPAVVACLLDADVARGGPTWGWDDLGMDFSEVQPSFDHNDAAGEGNEASTARAPSRRSTVQSPNGRPGPPRHQKRFEDLTRCTSRRVVQRRDVEASPDPVKSPPKLDDGLGGCLFCRVPAQKFDNSPRIVGQPLEPDESASNVGRRQRPGPPPEKNCAIA